jgi:septation ring formation regulator
MYWLIVLIILIIASGIVGAYYRKKIYKEVDRLEALKVQLLNKPLVTEISKIKELSINEQTDQAVEQWRTEWEELINQQFPNVEEIFYDIEEAADRFNIKKAKGLISDAEKRLLLAEEKMDQVMEEINEMMHFEEQNQIDELEVKETFRNVKKVLLSNHETYGTVSLYFEAELSNIKKAFQLYKHESDKGHFVAARKELKQVKERLLNIEKKMEQAPKVNELLQTKLPADLQNLKEGFEQMLEQGYYLEHLPIEKEIAICHSEMKKIKKYLMNAELDQVLLGIEKLESQIESAYIALEQEAIAKNEVQYRLDEVKQKLTQALLKMSEIKADTEKVKETYHIDIDDLNSSVKLEEEMEIIKQRVEALSTHMDENNKGYSILLKELNDLQEKLTSLFDTQLAFLEMIQTLRKDELKAKTSFEKLTQQLISCKRLIEKSNLPGLPESYIQDIAYTEDKVYEVYKQLEKTPLQMNVINGLLKDAVQHVEESYQKTEEMIKQSEMTEKLIQYGNRYRSMYSEVAERLDASERAFRTYQYEESLEYAVEALKIANPYVVDEIMNESSDKIASRI